MQLAYFAFSRMYEMKTWAPSVLSQPKLFATFDPILWILLIHSELYLTFPCSALLTTDFGGLSIQDILCLIQVLPHQQYF